MTVTALPTAEAPDRDKPRRLFMQPWFATMTTRGIDPTSEANAEHRTWLERTAADVFDDLAERFEQELDEAFRQAARRKRIPDGGFLNDHDTRWKAIRGAFAAGCAEVMAGELVQS
jgi:hypothetical protein